MSTLLHSTQSFYFRFPNQNYVRLSYLSYTWFHAMPVSPFFTWLPKNIDQLNTSWRSSLCCFHLYYPTLYVSVTNTPSNLRLRFIWTVKTFTVGMTTKNTFEHIIFIHCFQRSRFHCLYPTGRSLYFKQIQDNRWILQQFEQPNSGRGQHSLWTSAAGQVFRR